MDPKGLVRSAPCTHEVHVHRDILALSVDPGLSLLQDRHLARELGENNDPGGREVEADPRGRNGQQSTLALWVRAKLAYKVLPEQRRGAPIDPDVPKGRVAIAAAIAAAPCALQHPELDLVHHIDMVSKDEELGFPRGPRQGAGEPLADLATLSDPSGAIGRLLRPPSAFMAFMAAPLHPPGGLREVSRRWLQVQHLPPLWWELRRDLLLRPADHHRLRQHQI
mmetsp:Transcript_5319/g.19138  ORF Transcript_5319/g.19138 Transcript_5319/m.19138 type:complete len:223 (+) Transcript_5319:157-825(+)